MSIMVSEFYPHLAHPFILVKADSDALRITPEFAIAIMVMITTTFVRVACYRALGTMFTFKLAIKKDHRLVTSGPYAIVRHPSYAAILVYEIALSIVEFGRGSWWYESGYWETWTGAVAATVWNLVVFGFSWAFLARVEREDKMLQREFGKEWDEWRRNTPFKLIPYVW